MRINLWGAILALVTLGLGFSASARAEEFASTAELIGRLEAAEAQINRLESALANNNGGGCGCNDGCNNGCCDSCCDQSGWYAGAEIVALKVYQSEDNYGNNDFQPGVRLWLGAQRSDGLGLRLRWFDYTQDIDGDVVDIENIDLEVTDAFVLGNWSGLVSGGVRYTDFRSDFYPVSLSATGLTFGLQANRALRGPLSIYAAVQESLMFGSGDADGDELDNITFSITELQLGIQADRCLASGGTMFVRTGVEGQFYCGADDWDSESIGLFGFFATVGVMR